MRYAALVLLAACGARVPAPQPEPAVTDIVIGPRVEKPTTPTTEEGLGTMPAGVGVAVGQPAPGGAVFDGGGNEVDLAALWSDRPVLLVFYRGGWCPTCNFQIRELTLSWDGFDSRGVLPVAVSVDPATEAAKTAATYEVPFPTLADPSGAAHRAWGVLMQLDEEEYERLFGESFESGGRAHFLAIPSIFLVQDGVVRWAHADPEYTVRPTPEQLFAVIDRTLSRAP